MTDKFICNMCGGELTKLRVDEYNPISKKTYPYALVCTNHKCQAHNLNQVYIEELEESWQNKTGIKEVEEVYHMLNPDYDWEQLYGMIKSTNAYVSCLTESVNSNVENIKELFTKIQELNLKYWHRLTLLEDYVFMNDVDLQKKISKIRGEDPRQKKITDVNPKNEC